jgi:hypothetical protein
VDVLASVVLPDQVAGRIMGGTGSELVNSASGFLTHKEPEMREAQSEAAWFYEDNGQRKGPVLELELVDLIKASVISPGTAVWKQGFPEWSSVENTELRIHLGAAGPPPLSGEKVNNTIVWVLAFAPLIGYFLESFIAGAVHGNEFAAAVAMANNNYWYVTLALNIVLAFSDEKRLKAAGHNTEKFKGWVWLVPVYLYQRAKATKQNFAYFIVWVACFVWILFS